ncbi:hypothetical protein [Oceanospirillum sanctuarii]|uniref:hypothetical protein n=1 Tax=Oceanospirillum sanctuarii TaxID=1434821 RepID=UPI000A3C6011|nr:hypothetical protein [Oceanospirillum sanctuarii]
MTTEIKRKTLHYKRAVITNQKLTLQSLLSATFKQKAATKAKSRREFLNPEDESCRLINHHKEQNGMFFGELVFFEKGRGQALITLDDEAESYEINTIGTDSIKTDERDPKSQKEKSSQKEFIDSILYFGVLDNHLVILQSAALKARELETHLAWLMGTCTNVIGKNQAVILQDKPTEETIKRIEKAPVKTVSLGAPIQTVPVMSEDFESHHDSDNTQAAKSVKWIPKGVGVDIIKALLNEDWLNKLDLKDSLDESNLQVSLEISYLRKTTKTGQTMLNNIATALRHTEESDVSIHLNGGGTIKGKDLKLSGVISVKTNNGLVDQSDLFHQMHSWMVTKVTSAELELESSESSK